MCCHGHTAVISIQCCTTKYFELLVPPLLSKYSNTLSLQKIGFVQISVPVSATLYTEVLMYIAVLSSFNNIWDIFHIIIDASKGKYENPPSETGTQILRW
jgi:hypothetical protein